MTKNFKNRTIWSHYGSRAFLKKTVIAITCGNYFACGQCDQKRENVRDLGKLIVAKGFQSGPKSTKSPNLVTLSVAEG